MRLPTETPAHPPSPARAPGGSTQAAAGVLPHAHAAFEAPTSVAPAAPPPAPRAKRAAPRLDPALRGVLGLLAFSMVVALLYFGQDLIVPLALAALLAFVLDPLVTRLRRWHLPRGAAVGLVMLGTVLVVGSASLFVAAQTVALGQDLPAYQKTVQTKLRALRGALAHHGVLGQATRMVEVVNDELDATREALEPKPRASTPAAPVRVQVQATPPSAAQALGDLAGSVLGPLTSAGLVLVFLVFMLLDRTDLRDRVLRLVGGDLQRSTHALDEAGHRVSRYLTTQLGVNSLYAVLLALGLWLLGVPSAPLWGALAGLLRFVPYVGPLIAAVFPLTMAFAVDPGWQMMLWTATLILLLDVLIAYAVEPWLYGHSTGLAPTAVLLAAAFWTTLWGPIGLILSTPMTVCLVVLGRHLPGLQFLDVLLGRSPAFDPSTRLHQRLLAGDLHEAAELALSESRQRSPQAFYNEHAAPMLQQAASTHRRLTSLAQRQRLAAGMRSVLAQLRTHFPAAQPPDTAAQARADAGPTARPPAHGDSPQVLCVGLQRDEDTLGAAMLAHALALKGLPAVDLSAAALAPDRLADLPLQAHTLLCLWSFSPQPSAQARRVCRRLRQHWPDLRIVLLLWRAPAELLRDGAHQALGAAALSSDLNSAVQALQGLVADGATLSAAPPDWPSAAPSVAPSVAPSAGPLVGPLAGPSTAAAASTINLTPAAAPLSTPPPCGGPHPTPPTLQPT